MEIFASVIIITICYALGPAIKFLLDFATNDIELVPPNSIDISEWENFTKPKHRDKAGKWLGFLERLLFFFSFYSHAYVIIAGWLALKVASKWQVWVTIIKMPNNLVGQEDNISYLTARQRWGSWLHMRFLIGTNANLLIGFIMASLLDLIVN